MIVEVSVVRVIVRSQHTPLSTYFAFEFVKFDFLTQSHSLSRTRIFVCCHCKQHPHSAGYGVNAHLSPFGNLPLLCNVREIVVVVSM